MSEDTAHETSAPWYSKRWLVIVAIFFAVFSMAVIGISVAAHLAWQASPEKALLDALDYSSKTPATYKVNAKDIDATVSYDGKRQAVTGKYEAVQFNAVVDGNMLYLKTSTPAELVKLFTSDDLPENLRPMADMITQRITDKWVSVSLDRLPLTNKTESKKVSCVLNAKSQLMTNKESKKELIKLYDANSFLAAEKSATTDESNAYKVSLHNDRFDAFNLALKRSDFYTSLKSDCEPFVQSVVGMKNRDSGIELDVMLSKSKNALQKATLQSANSGTTTVDVRYGDVGTITIPSDSLSYDDISNTVIQTIVQAYLGINR